MIKLTPKRISELDLAATLTGTERVALVQNSQTRQQVLSVLKEYFDESGKITLVSRSNQVCTDADTIEKYLETYTLEPNTLAVDGEWLDIFVSFDYNPNVNNRTLKFYFGAQSFGQTLTTTAARTAGNLRLIIQRIDNTFQKYSYVFNTYSRAPPQAPDVQGTFGFFTQTLSAAIPIAISGQNGVAHYGDICLEQFIITKYKLDPES